jgi:hypothetical protein
VKGNGKHLRKLFVCYAVLANKMLAFGNAVVMVDGITQRNLNDIEGEITSGLKTSHPELECESVTITFFRELEG